MQDSFSNIESMMKEINAMKFCSDDSDLMNNDESSRKSISNTEFEFNTQINFSKSEQTNNIDSINLTEQSSTESQSNSINNNNLSDYYSKTSDVSNKKIISEKSRISYSQKNNEDYLDSTVLSFIKKFNSKYNTHITDLNDIFDVVDDLKEKITEFVPLGHNYDEYNGQIKLKKANAQITSLMEQNTALIQTKSSFEKAFASVEQLLDNQIEETKKLSQQRNKLVQYLQTMDIVCREFDDAGHNLKLLHNKKSISLLQLQQMQEQQNNEKNKLKEEEYLSKEVQRMKDQFNDESYQLLASAYRVIDINLNKSFKDEIDQIKDNSTKTASERLLSIIKCIINHYNKDIQKQEESIKLNQELTNQLNNSKKQCKDIIHHFEDELRFLQKLSHSNEIQSVIFYRPTEGTSLSLDSKSKNELIKRCAEIGKYIDENVGKILLENVEPYFSDLESSLSTTFNADTVFSLMQPANIEKKVASIINPVFKINHEFESDDNSNAIYENRKLFDLLIAQVLMNDILTSHAMSLRTKVSIQNRQIQKLDQNDADTNELRQQLVLYQNEIRNLRHIDSKIRKKVSKVIRFENCDQTIQIVKALVDAVKHLKKQQKKVQRQIQITTNSINIPTRSNNNNNNHISKKTEATSPCHSFNDHNSNKLKEEIKQITEEKDIQIKFLEDKIVKINSEIQEKMRRYEKEIRNYQNQNQSLISQIEKQNREISKVGNSNKEKIYQCESIIEKQKIEISELQKKLNDSITALKKLTSQYKRIESTNSATSIENQQLKKRIKQLESINMNGVESIKSKCSSLRSQYELTINELQKVRTENSSMQQILLQIQAEGEKLKSENDELKIQNKALLLKIKAIDEKHQVEMKTYQTQISANATSMQADLDHIRKENEEKICDLKNRILEVTMKYCDSTDPFEAVKKLADMLNDLRKVQSLYSSMIEDVQNLQKLLNVEPGLKITPHVERLIRKINENESQIQNKNKCIDSTNVEKQKIAKELMKNQNQIASLIQWENWAKRVLRVVKETDCSQFSNDMLRQTLEEIILNTISSRSTLGKMEILRQEKRLMTKYEPRFLNLSSNSNLNSITPLLIVITALKRLQKLAGCVPISAESHSKNSKRSKKF